MKLFRIALILIIIAFPNHLALAQTFKDVPTDAWYYDYVEQLVDDSVIDQEENYQPEKPLTRAELVKMVILATDGLAGYAVPFEDSFRDVKLTDPNFKYIEAAVQLGIIEGYKDINGNLTDYFGPNDVVNRATAAKILVEAFAVPTTLDPTSIFPDVTKGAWFYDYVLTAYNQSILDGYDNGDFGPVDPVTRAQIAKLIVNAQDPVPCRGQSKNNN